MSAPQESAEKIARRLGGIRNGAGWMCSCPVPGRGRGRGDRNPSLAMADGESGRVLVRCFAGCDPRDVLAALSIRGERHERVVIPLPAPPSPDDGERTARARAIWSESRPAAGTLAEVYLRSRSITIEPPASLRYHPALWHSGARRKMPAMVAAVQSPDGRIVAIHRTWLKPDGGGKADIDGNKMALGPCRGGAVRLVAAGEYLQLSEGVETGLALLQATGNPVWATLGTAGLAAVILPETVRRVTICADGDEPGEHAAIKAAKRFAVEGRQVRIARPPAGYDFLDVLSGRVPPPIEGAAA